MSKAILVIDKPKFCSLCMFCNRTRGFYGFEEERCRFTNHLIHYDTKPENRQCPLRELPEKIDIESCRKTKDYYDDGYDYGWNACLEEILEE